MPVPAKPDLATALDYLQRPADRQFRVPVVAGNLIVNCIGGLRDFDKINSHVTADGSVSLTFADGRPIQVIDAGNTDASQHCDAVFAEPVADLELRKNNDANGWNINTSGNKMAVIYPDGLHRVAFQLITKLKQKQIRALLGR